MTLNVYVDSTLIVQNTLGLGTRNNFDCGKREGLDGQGKALYTTCTRDQRLHVSSEWQQRPQRIKFTVVEDSTGIVNPGRMRDDYRLSAMTATRRYIMVNTEKN